MAYKRKTRDEWHMFANYGHGEGWEHETTETSWKDMRQTLKDYRANCPEGQYKAKKVRVKANS